MKIDLTWQDSEDWKYWTKGYTRMKLSFSDSNNDPIVLRIDTSGGLDIKTIDNKDPVYIQYSSPQDALQAARAILGDRKSDEEIRLQKELEYRVQTEKNYLISKGFSQSEYYQDTIYKDIDDIKSLVIMFPDELDQTYSVEVEFNNFDNEDAEYAPCHSADNFDTVKQLVNEILDKVLL